MTENNQPLLIVEGATVAFGGVLAVNDVSLSVAEGEIVGLVGPNGAGKSTLFGAVAGAVPLKSGNVTLGGELLTGRKAGVVARRGVARTFQKVRLFHSMTALENVLVAARVSESGHGTAERLAHEALATVNFQPDPNSPVSALALADRKRIEIARALASRPRLILLDEMMNGLTAAETDDIVAAVKALPAQGITVMLVEHVLPIVRRLCDRLAVLHHGQLIAQGDPGTVLSRDDVVEAWLGRAQTETER